MGGSGSGERGADVGIRLRMRVRVRHVGLTGRSRFLGKGGRSEGNGEDEVRAMGEGFGCCMCGLVDGVERWSALDERRE